jgi:hypothetical protein
MDERFNVLRRIRCEVGRFESTRIFPNYVLFHHILLLRNPRKDVKRQRDQETCTGACRYVTKNLTTSISSCSVKFELFRVM